MKARVHFGKWKSRRRSDVFVTRRTSTGRSCGRIRRSPSTSQPTSVRHAQYRWPGDDARTPVVFLHGSGGTALAWSGYVTRIGGRVAIGIDTIGDAGRSKQDVAVEDAADYAAWLEETLVGLDVERADLVGMSYGGFLALNQAALSRTASPH